MLAREQAFIRHLVVALKSEGHRVTFIAQHGLDLSLLPTLGSRLCTYRWNRWERLGMLQRLRLAGVVEELTTRPADILLLWGAADAAPVQIVLEATQVPAVVWCWDASELFTPLIRLPQVRHAIVSSLPIAERVPPNFRIPATLIHPGVYADDALACYDVPGQLPCLVSLDPLSNVEAYEALIRACRKIADDGLEFLLFAYDQGHQEHPIWQLAERLDLLDRISFVPFQLDAEPLLLHGDLYLHVLPTSRVQYRTLEALGRGLAVVTCPNPGADYLVDGQTCRIVRAGAGDAGSAEAWREVLHEMITDRLKAAHIARRGQQMVRDRHEITRTLSQFTSVCRQAAGTPLRLTAG